MKQNKIIWLVFVLALGGLILYFATQKNVGAKGGKAYGGTLSISSKNKALSLYPLANNTLEAQRLQWVGIHKAMQLMTKNKISR